METPKRAAVPNLDSLLLNLTGLDDSAVEELGLRHYRELYVPAGKYGVLQTHDGEEVRFFADRYEHAFWEPEDWRFSDRKAAIARGRVERIKWIKEFISGNVPNSECWAIPISARAYKRLYASFAKTYLVWIMPRSEGGWWFSSAYNGDAGHIRNNIKQKGAKRISRF